MTDFVSGDDRIYPRKAFINGDAVFHSGFSSTVDEFISADTGLGGEGGIHK